MIQVIIIKYGGPQQRWVSGIEYIARLNEQLRKS